MNDKAQHEMEDILERLTEELSDKTLDSLKKFLQDNPVNTDEFVKELFTYTLEEHHYRNSGDTF